MSLQSRLYQIQPQLFDQPAKGSKKTAQKRAADEADPRSKRLLQKLTKIQNDVLFDQHEAEVKWLEKLNDLRKEAAFTREKERTVEKPIAPPKEPEPEPEKVDEPLLDAANSGDEGLFGEMFAADMNNGPSSFLETPNSHHLLRDFGKPSGLNPRRVLEEACKAR